MAMTKQEKEDAKREREYEKMIKPGGKRDSRRVFDLCIGYFFMD